jgi:hypothetical protein
MLGFHTLLLPVFCYAVDVPLVTFDGAEKTTHTWESHDDPVMGGKSKSTTQVSGGVLAFKGKCAIVPFLKAPGFVTTRTQDGKWADVSSCSAIKITAKSNVNYKGYRISFGSAQAPGGGHFAYGYKANLTAPIGKFDDVVIPLTDFTDDWNDGTGNPVKTCAEDKRLCPDKKTLRNMGTMSIWGEGVEGDVDLEVKYVGGANCGSINDPIAAGAVTVYDFSAPQGVNFYEVNDPVMGGASTGTFNINSAEGYGRLNGTVALIPFLKAPGFIKALACRDNVPVGRFHGGVCHKVPNFPDISAQSRFVIRARSNTQDYAGFKFSFNSYKADFNVTSQWSDIVLPFTSFSNKWSGATGEPTKKCSDDPSVCPTKDALAKVQDMEIWAEGHAGDVTLDIQKITAEAAAAMLV